MKILLTNDDGFYAEGLQVLVNALKDEHELYLCAPKQHMSGMGHAITVARPIHVKKAAVKGVNAAYIVDGTPSDCAKIACLHLFKEVAFDLVISGINNGANVGDDIIYSGTVSAAHEAYRYGNHAIALSAANKDRSRPMNFSYAAEHAREFIKTLDLTPDHFLYNVNYPYNARPRGLMYAVPSVVGYREKISVTGDCDEFKIRFTGTPFNRSSERNNDFDLIDMGYATIAPVKLSVKEEHIDDNVQAIIDLMAK